MQLSLSASYLSSMGNEFDFEKIQHIIEKIERWEVLNASEKEIAKIIEVLNIQKKQSIPLDRVFQHTLKKELLEKYDELYTKKWWYQKALSVWQMPVLRLTISFCFIVTLTLWIYGGMGILQNTKPMYEWINLSENSNTSLDSEKNISLEQKSESRDYWSPDTPSQSFQRKWINFWSNNVSSWVMGPSSNTSDHSYTQVSYIVMAIVLLAGIIALIIVKRRKRKDIPVK